MPKIIQIATSSDGRVIALGDNGKAYWYYSIKNSRGDILESGWNPYPDLPSEGMEDLQEDQF